MGGVPSTPRDGGARPQESAEYLLGEFIGEKSYPLGSNLWQQLLELPLDRRWQGDHVDRACEVLSENNVHTRHLAKILIHLAWCLQKCTSNAEGPSSVYLKAVNALYISSLFLKHLIENAKNENFEELYLSLDETEPVPVNSIGDKNIENLVMHSVVSCISSVDISLNTYMLHQELLNFMLVAMATQLRCGPSPGPRDVNPFIDAAMAQETSLISLLVQKLLLNYLIRPRTSFGGAPYSSDKSQAGVLQKVGSAAANLVLLPINFLVSSRGEVSRSPWAEYSLLVLLVLIHYRKCDVSDESLIQESDPSAKADSLSKETTSFCDNPYCKTLEHAQDVELDVKVNASDGPVARVPFGPLFDTLSVFDLAFPTKDGCGTAKLTSVGSLLTVKKLMQRALDSYRCLWNESAVLLLYSLVQGNSAFLEYVLVRTDIDTLLIPILETLYNASRRSSNHIYMLLIILLILSQDSTFNASIHKLTLPSVPWYQERLLHHTSLGSLTVIILIRTVKYNLSKMRDVYLHTNCLATLANMAPHCHHLSAYASERLISLFNMLSKKYNRLAELRDKSMIQGDRFVDDVSTEFYIYTDFLRIVLEILNEILTYALPRNPEVIYVMMHRQEIFRPFKHHPRFSELLENIYTVLDFFNSRIDSQKIDGEWSVEKVLQIIINNCRFWRGEGMKMFTQLRFTYEQESQSEEFFIPYIWRLVLPICGFSFKDTAMNLYPVDVSPDLDPEKQPSNGEMTNNYREVDVKELS